MMDFRQRLEQSRPNYVSTETIAEPEEIFECPFFATNRSKDLVCLDLRLPKGMRKAISYSYFVEIDFDLEKGIEIRTTQKRIRVTGRNLGKLFDHLIAYRVRYIQVNRGIDAGEDGLFVKEIFVDEL